MSQVHAIFHLVANDRNQSNLTFSENSPVHKTLKQSDLSSRHPVITANI